MVVVIEFRAVQPDELFATRNLSSVPRAGDIVHIVERNKMYQVSDQPVWQLNASGTTKYIVRIG